MMGVSRSDAMDLSLWEYEARLWHWNDAHSTGEDIEAPDRDLTQRLIDRLNGSALIH